MHCASSPASRSTYSQVCAVIAREQDLDEAELALDVLAPGDLQALAGANLLLVRRQHGQPGQRRSGGLGDRHRDAAAVVARVDLGEQAGGVDGDTQIEVAGRRQVGDVDPLAGKAAGVEIAPADLHALDVEAVRIAAESGRVRCAVGCPLRVLDAERPLLAQQHGVRGTAGAELVAREGLEVEVLVARAVDPLGRAVRKQDRRVRRADDEIGRALVDREHAEAQQLPHAGPRHAEVRGLELAALRVEDLEVVVHRRGQQVGVETEVGHPLCGRERAQSQHAHETQQPAGSPHCVVDLADAGRARQTVVSRAPSPGPSPRAGRSRRDPRDDARTYRRRRT